jgi:cysteinyl-tRNA synthetase
MDDDFNTAIAVATLFDLIRYINKFIDSEGLEKKKTDSDLKILTCLMLLMRELTGTLGLFLSPPAQTSAGTDGKLLNSLMRLIIELRSRARKTKDFATADLIRASLTEADIQLEDRAEGTDWSIK